MLSIWKTIRVPMHMLVSSVLTLLPIPERGCAIFFHCSKGATGGCIGLPEADMVNTLLWLDPQENPYILITGYQRSAGN